MCFSVASSSTVTGVGLQEASAMMQAFVWGTLIRVVRATATAAAPQREAAQQFEYTYEGLFRVVSSGRCAPVPCRV